MRGTQQDHSSWRRYKRTTMRGTYSTHGKKTFPCSATNPPQQERTLHLALLQTRARHTQHLSLGLMRRENTHTSTFAPDHFLCHFDRRRQGGDRGNYVFDPVPVGNARQHRSMLIEPRKDSFRCRQGCFGALRDSPESLAYVLLE